MQSVSSMTLKDQIAIIKRWHEVKNMQYPVNPAVGEWFLFTQTSVAWDTDKIKEEWKNSGKEGEPEDPHYLVVKNAEYVGGAKHYQTNRYSIVFICIKQQGSTHNVNLGCADLALKNFPEKWKELAVAAKDRVDRLNSLDAAMELANPTQCAECNNNALEGDYLCGDCRGS